MQHSSGSSGSGNKRVRTACVVCRRRKIRCDGGFPCERCVVADQLCEYEAEVSNKFATLPMELYLTGVKFGSREMAYMDKYLQLFYTMCPVIPMQMFRDGAGPVSVEQLGLPGTHSAAKVHAAKTVCWAGAALGASFSDVSLAQDYMEASIRHLRECFEVPCEESVMAYLAVGDACFQLGKPDLYFRYAEFADAMEENMPTVSADTRYGLILCRLHVGLMSNGTRFCEKLALLPTPEEIQRMDVRQQVFFVEPLMSNDLRDALLSPNLSREEKVRACREAIDRATPVLERLERDDELRQCVILRMALHRPLSYLWAVCGDREKALHSAQCMLDLLERNLFYMAVPQIASASVISSLLEKLGAFDLQRRAEQLSLKGAKYVIWTPHRSLEIDMLRQLEALVEEVRSPRASQSPVVDASGEYLQQTSVLRNDTSTQMAEGVPGDELWADIDVAPDFWDALHDFEGVPELSR